MHQERKITLPSEANASGQTFGEEEISRLNQVIEAGTLTGTIGSQIPKRKRSQKKQGRCYKTGDWEKI